MIEKMDIKWTVVNIRMPTEQILQKLFDYHPKQRRERSPPLKRWRDD
jgi:hypothetical protein